MSASAMIPSFSFVRSQDENRQGKLERNNPSQGDAMR